MAGDWIKMRGNLWDDPRVSRLCDVTEQPEAAIIGGLYWLWASADQHSADGLMEGLTLRSIDRKTGVSGLGKALATIGWVEESDQGVLIKRFDEHNGASAKKRAQTARRVSNHKAGNANSGDEPANGNDQIKEGCKAGNASSVTTALPREEKRREEKEEEQVQKQKPRAARSQRQPAIVVEDVPEQLLADYLAIRKAKNVGPLTATALEQFRREAGKAGITLEAAMTACCGYGWAGFNHRWYLDRNSGRAGPANARQAENDRRGDEFLRLIGAPGSDPNTIDMES